MRSCAQERRVVKPMLHAWLPANTAREIRRIYFFSLQSHPVQRFHSSPQLLLQLINGLLLLMDLLHLGTLPLHRVFEAFYIGQGVQVGSFSICKKDCRSSGTGKNEIRIVLPCNASVDSRDRLLLYPDPKNFLKVDKIRPGRYVGILKSYLHLYCLAATNILLQLGSEIRIGNNADHKKIVVR